MNTSALQSFASGARRRLMGAVSAKLDAALAPGSSARVDTPSAVERLEHEIKEHGGGEQGRQHVVERYAYRWFNRIIAFRYMDVHGFTAVPVVSAVELTDVNGLPGVLVAAKRGEYDEDVFGGSSTMGNAKLRDTVETLFDGSLQSDDPQGQAYGLLLQAECRYWSQFMPFMFERVDSAQGKVDELLMPADLLAEGSVLRQAVATMTPDNCEDVEIIGWLYQFYIAERKTEVMNGFSKSKKAGADEIPAATQLFTPDWIVKYLVQNTVGRLWMQNHPDSQLYREWEYYIQPEPDQNHQSEFLHIDGPEELTVCDPACGSGHMLTYAFDLLYGIYEEQGYSPSEIPRLILANNLYGMEIDERAANLAAFALTMKARAKARRFFRKERQVQPHIRLITKERFTPDEVRELNGLYKTSLDADVWNTYDNADIVGSLILPPQELVELVGSQMDDFDGGEAVIERSQSVWREIDPNERQSDDALTLFGASLADRAKTVFVHTRYLARRYKAVVANPPYMGSKNMGDELKQFVQNHFEDGKGDLFAAFMLHSSIMLEPKGVMGMITMQSWMFLSSYEKLRKRILREQSILSMLHLGPKAFDTISGEIVSTTAFVLQREKPSDTTNALFFSLEKEDSSQKMESAKNKIRTHSYYLVLQKNFDEVPMSIIAYWLPDVFRHILNTGNTVSAVASIRQGFQTGNNDRFLRYWFEVSNSKLRRDATSIDDFHLCCKSKYAVYLKGGGYRKWYGNEDLVCAFDRINYDLLAKSGNHLPSRTFYFHPGITWSSTGNAFSARINNSGNLFSGKGAAAFPGSKKSSIVLLSIFNSSIIDFLLTFMSATLDYNVGNLKSIPLPDGDIPEKCIEANTTKLILCAKHDWDSEETSLDFSRPQFLIEDSVNLFSDAILSFTKYCKECSAEQRRCETLNNDLIADIYGVRNDVPCDVPLERVSLKRNSAFVYPDKTSAERDELFARDVVKEFISYAVGCMFGRYSIDKPGLILASQGETVDDFHERVPNTRFEPDKDNVIPVTEVDCFEDDIVSRFRRFLEVTFGSEHLAENLAYIERTLSKPLRKYFVNDFYKDHVAMYKNRPIYWQYSSRTDNQGTFKALIYLHRYTPATTHTVLEYLRDFTAKIADQADQLERSDRAKDKREAEKLHKAVTECKAYEDNILYPLATRNLEIDLDDGVLVNYLRMGQALRKIDPIEKKRKDVATWTWPVHPLDGDWR